VDMWTRHRFKTMWNPNPGTRSEKIGYLLFRAVGMTINTVLMFIVATAIVIAFDPNHLPSRNTALVIIAAATAWRLRSIVFLNLLAPDTPSHRMVNLTDAQAVSIYRDIRLALGVSIVTIFFCDWMKRLDLDADAHKLSLIGSMLIGAILIAFLMIRHRAAVRDLVLGSGDPETKPVWRRALAAVADELALVYLAIAFAVSTTRVVLDLPSATLLVAAPAIAIIGAIAAYGVLLILLDAFHRGRKRAYDLKVKQAVHEAMRQRQIEEEARAEALRRGMETTEEVIVNEGMRRATGLIAEKPFRPVFKPLLEQSAGIVVTLAAIGYVLGAWDVKIGERGNPVAAFMGTLSVVFAAWFLYRAVGLYIDRKLEDEGVGHGLPRDLEDEPGGVGTTRLGTLLPLLRNVFIAGIFAVAGMIILSNLGVDIAPLFAGAGVIGLAIGFGAQTMIRDIFSGGFFLFDDAFRKGEYIELGDIRGTVEKISLRSFQLRHHNGPLHTVPFGEISRLTNYSRDWVIMKLPLRLTYDTDVDRVRKLVKKLGIELLKHPEVGSHFLQPLKSQGVVEMDDSAMIVRVKFMTKPGDQWQTRKVVYSAIQELFHREGIRFANREVTVRIEGRGSAVDLDDEAVEKAASAAARQVVDDSARKRKKVTANDL
ncbi:MAG TPA: mechanosensitive ion channel domain-containing protein, partial [Rhizobiaceae bacterium]|nr:mechanosensitive ion channel domain-containing protein [Rhizobiaceae bacterium]